MKTFDLVIIGGGPGGYVAAIRGAQQGASVCLIERDRLGGTCLNRGCIPTKALYSSARVLEMVREAEVFGVRSSAPDFDFPQAMARKSEVVAKLVGGIEQLVKANKIECVTGTGSLEGEGVVAIRHKNIVGRVKGKKIILASGSVPAVPNGIQVDGVRVVTSDHLLSLTDFPPRLLVIGGGYIGSEFASIFATFGSQVTVVEMLPRLLMQSDRQVVREVEKALKEKGVEILTETAVEGVTVSGDEVQVALSGGKTVTVDRVLVSVGRRALSEELQLDRAGVEAERGIIKVDAGMRTSNPDIYAIGDVSGGIQLAHVASYEAGIAVANALGADQKADYRVVPSAIFTLPEIGQVGLTEEDCKRLEIPCKVGRFMYQASGKALCAGEPAGTIKICAAMDGEILGASIVGAEASTLIAEVSNAMATRMKAHDLASVIHAHPTLPEIVMEAAEDVDGVAVHKAGRPSKR